MNGLEKKVLAKKYYEEKVIELSELPKNKDVLISVDAIELQNKKGVGYILGEFEFNRSVSQEIINQMKKIYENEIKIITNQINKINHK